MAARHVSLALAAALLAACAPATAASPPSQPLRAAGIAAPGVRVERVLAP